MHLRPLRVPQRPLYGLLWETMQRYMQRKAVGSLLLEAATRKAWGSRVGYFEFCDLHLKHGYQALPVVLAPAFPW